jgi:hypothetical protein
MTAFSPLPQVPIIFKGNQGFEASLGYIVSSRPLSYIVRPCWKRKEGRKEGREGGKERRRVRKGGRERRKERRKESKLGGEYDGLKLVRPFDISEVRTEVSQLERGVVSEEEPIPLELRTQSLFKRR